MSVRRTRAARVLSTLAALAGCWTIATLVTEGVRLHVAGLTVSSRNPVRPALAAIGLASLTWILDPRWATLTGATVLGWASRVRPKFLVLLAAGGVLAAGIAFGGRAAAGADASGYLSQSILWLRGDLTIEQPVVAKMPWPDADWTFTPLGYRPAPEHTLVPTYAPGLPLLLAGARLISSSAPFYLVPACGALLVLFTWMLGRRVFGETTATSGAILVATSPVVLMWSLATMSDVPVATFWIGALLAADGVGLKRVAAAGLLTGIAIVIRPNLAPLALFPMLLNAVHGGGLRGVLERCAILAAAVAPFAAFVGLVNQSLYGSALTSGYGTVASIYSPRHLPANLIRYPAWWWAAHGVIGWLFVAALFKPYPSKTKWRVLVLSAFAAAVLLAYLFYLPFDHWGFLRFLLPALPVTMLLSADVVVWLSARLGVVASTYVVIAVTGLAVTQGVHGARSGGLFANAEADQRYADAGVYIDSITPPQAVVLAMQHSGSVRFYSGRLTLRYDLLDEGWLDRAIDHLEALGLPTYALLEDWEEEVFRKRFGAQATRALGARPVSIRPTGGGELRFFALRDRSPASGGLSSEMPRTSRFDCIQPSPRFGMPIEP